jgi:hypothetical protein
MAESWRTEWWHACRLPVNWKLAEEAFMEQYHVIETLCVPKTSSGLVTWTNVLRLLEPSTDDLAADSQDPTTGNTGSATVAPWWDCITA